MPYIFKKYYLDRPKRAFRFLMDELGVSMNEAQKIIDRGRLKVGGDIFRIKGAEIFGEVEVFGNLSQDQLN